MFLVSSFAVVIGLYLYAVSHRSLVLTV